VYVCWAAGCPKKEAYHYSPYFLFFISKVALPNWESSSSVGVAYIWNFMLKSKVKRIASPCYNNERLQLAVLAAIDEINTELTISFCNSLNLSHRSVLFKVNYSLKFGVNFFFFPQQFFFFRGQLFLTIKSKRTLILNSNYASILLLTNLPLQSICCMGTRIGPIVWSLLESPQGIL